MKSVEQSMSFAKQVIVKCHVHAVIQNHTRECNEEIK
jgi:hypothetical protein